MRIDLYIHTEDEDKLEKLIHHLISQNKIIMEQNEAIKAQIATAFSNINESTNNIADDITRLAAKIAPGGLTVEESQKVADDLTGVATKLKDIAAVTPEELT